MKYGSHIFLILNNQQTAEDVLSNSPFHLTLFLTAINTTYNLRGVRTWANTTASVNSTL